MCIEIAKPCFFLLTHYVLWLCKIHVSILISILMEHMQSKRERKYDCTNDHDSKVILLSIHATDTLNERHKVYLGTIH